MMRVQSRSSEWTRPQGPPWEALFLVGHHLDPKTLAAASGASKAWFLCLSSDHLWRPLCSAAFPSLHRHHADASVSYRHLYSLGYTAERRRLRKLPKPALSLDSLLFAVAIETPEGASKTVVKPCGSLRVDPDDSLFRFDVDVEDPESWTVDALDGVKVTWHVVVQGWKRVFCMMECRRGRGKGGKGGVRSWFSEELPSPGCCSRSMASGLVGDLGLRVRSLGDDEVVVEKVSLGVLSMYSWRYVTVTDALSYLQHFLCQV